MCKVISLCKASRDLGKHPDFFTHVKRNTPKLHRLMSIYGRGNLFAGAEAYFKATERIREELANMYYELSSCKCFTRFFNDTKEKNPYIHVGSLNATLKSSAFTTTDRAMRFHGYVSSRKLLGLYTAWKEKGYTEDEKRVIREMYGN